MSRPSRSQVQVRIGSFANGRPRLSTYHWHSCKIAHLRDGAVEGARPNLGRRPDPPTDKTLLTDALINKQNDSASEMEGNFAAKIQTSKQTRAVSSNVEVSESSPPASPSAIQTSNSQVEMNYNQNEPYKRPVRSTRNPRPQYIDSITY